MIIANGATSVTTYFVLRDSTTHEPDTGLTVTNIDLYYVEQGAAIAAKIDCTALAAADSAYTSGGAFHCGYGLYRIDWPNAAFDGGIGKKVMLIVICTGADNSYLEVELSPPVDVKQWAGSNVAAVSVAGVPEVDVTYVAGVLASGTGTPNVSVAEIQAAALADLFNTDSGSTYGAAVAGSPVKEIADNANVQKINDITVGGAGTEGSPWGPA